MKDRKLVVVYRKINDLIPYVNNARTHSEEQVTQLASAIKEFGFTNPILLDGENGILAGHGRLEAGKKLGLEEVPTIDISGLSEAQKKAYILADNKLALNAGWDYEKLKIEFEELQGLNYDFDLIGFNTDEINSILGDFEVPETEEFYQVKTDSIQYEYEGTAPPISDLVDKSKATRLIEEIDKSNLSSAEKEFLRDCASRHLKFNYKKIAEFYCSTSPEVQKLMEDSALVIIDFDDAIKKGYVQVTKKLNELLKNSEES